MLTAVPKCLDSNPGEDMDVCKCIVSLKNRGTLNSLRAASPLLRLMEGEERCWIKVLVRFKVRFEDIEMIGFCEQRYQQQLSLCYCLKTIQSKRCSTDSGTPLLRGNWSSSLLVLGERLPPQPLKRVFEEEEKLIRMIRKKTGGYFRQLRS
ncbi:hypothetical protein TNCV_948901 [Trichonephila clavipes]|nr:hypothetical protein TNCV_948901 [Trichonephila clavipes]